MTERFTSPSALREFALETASQLQSAGQIEAGKIMNDAANFVTVSGWEWLGELAHAAEQIQKRFVVSQSLAMRLARIRDTAISQRPYGSHEDIAHRQPNEDRFVSATSEPQFRSLDLPGKHVTRAWMAATVSAGLTLIFGALGAAGVFTAPGLNAWILMDAAILAGLAYGVWRHSRVCALLLLTYGIANEIYLALDGTANFSILRVVFIYFYFRGTIQLFREHRARPAPQIANLEQSLEPPDGGHAK